MIKFFSRVAVMFPWFFYTLLFLDSMRFLDSAKVYNTETGILVKENVSREDLEDGWVRYTTRSLYYRGKSKDYWMHVRKVCTDRKANIIDKQDYCYKIDEEYIRSFNRTTDTP